MVLLLSPGKRPQAARVCFPGYVQQMIVHYILCILYFFQEIPSRMLLSKKHPVFCFNSPFSTSSFLYFLAIFFNKMAVLRGKWVNFTFSLCKFSNTSRLRSVLLFPLAAGIITRILQDRKGRCPLPWTRCFLRLLLSPWMVFPFGSFF